MYKPLPDNLKIACSKIHGHGIFATENISQGDMVGRSHVEGLDEIIRTPLGGYINHLDEPNCIRERVGSEHFLVAKRLIKKGEELTVKYQWYDVNQQENQKALKY